MFKRLRYVTAEAAWLAWLAAASLEGRIPWNFDKRLQAACAWLDHQMGVQQWK